MARLPTTANCSIDGCERAQHRGYLCAKHHRMVPLAMTMRCAADAMQASHAVAERHHLLWLDYVRGAV